MTRIITDMTRAIHALHHDNIVAIPTETVYGLAADVTNEQAMHKIFKIKNRPLNHPLIMHVCPEWDLHQWVADIPAYAYPLMEAFWPGPLTFVFNRKPNAVSDLVTGGQQTIAIRAPNHPVILDLLRKLNSPLVAPSANPFGQISPTTANHVEASFPDADFLILDGGRCPVGIESTIIQATASDHYHVLRSGVIDMALLDSIADEHAPEYETALRVPGRLKSHYKPSKPLYTIKHLSDIGHYCDPSRASLYLIGFSAEPPIKKAGYHQLPNHAADAAYELYYELRRADESDADCIIIELPPNGAMWLGIHDRLLKAGQPIAQMP